MRACSSRTASGTSTGRGSTSTTPSTFAPRCFSPKPSPRRRAALPDGTDASIVNLLDQRIYKSTPNYLSYGLAKNALYAATTTLAQALAPRVRVNAVAPGPALPNTRQDAETFARLSRAMPLGRGAVAGGDRRGRAVPRRRPQRDRPDHRGGRRPALELAGRSGEQRLDNRRAPAPDSTAARIGRAKM